MAVPLNMAIALQGVDATAGAFGSVAARAKAVGAKVAAGLKTATMAAAGVSVAVGAAAKAALNSMNELNDTAQRAGVSAEWLQRFSGAMGQAGIQMQQTDIVGTIQKLNAGLVNTEKITALQKLGVDISHLKGLKPEEAFMGFLDIVSKIPDEQTRLLALMRGMEEQGLKLAPLMRLGPDAFNRSIRDVMDIIPAVSDNTVTIATNANNAFALVGQSFQTIWYEVLGGVLKWGEESFGGLDVAIMTTWEHTKAYSLVFVRACQTWGEAVGSVIALFRFDFRDALDMIGYRIVQWGSFLHTPFKKLAESMGWETLSQAYEMLDAEIERGINSIHKKHGFEITSSFSDKVKADFEQMQVNIEKWEKGLSAKAELSAFSGIVPEAPELKEIKPIEPAVFEVPETLTESVSDAVSRGVETGLAEGVESSSYTVLKNAFKASAAHRPLWDLSGAFAAMTTSAAVSPVTGGTSGGGTSGGGIQGEILAVLKQIFESADKTQKGVAALGAF